MSVEKEKTGWYINVKKQNVTQRSKKLKQKVIVFLLYLMTLAQIFTFSVKNALSKNYGIKEKTIIQHAFIAIDEDDGWDG